MTSEVEIIGLPELIRALKQVDSGLVEGLKRDFVRIANLVVSDAQSTVPHKTGKAASSIKARGTTKGASIAFGGTAAPYYPWLDFGGNVGRKKAIHRDFIKKGRYVYPAIERNEPMIRSETDKTLEKIIKAAGFETRE